MLCNDCALYVTNGETPTDADQLRAWRDGVALHADHSNPGQWVVTSTDDSDVDPFSSAPCYMCDTSLAGERFPAEWVPTNPCGAFVCNHDH